MSDGADADVDGWLPTTPESAPFFEGARAGKFRLQCCDDCDTWMYPVKERCQECGSTLLSWRDASGRGTLYSYGLLRRVYHPRHEGRLPLVLASVDTEEGVRVSTNLIDIDPAMVKVGINVEVAFETLPDGGVLPVFRPV